MAERGFAAGHVRRRKGTSGRLPHRAGSIAGSALLLCLAAQPLSAEPNEKRPYDDKLHQLAEVLGAVHYLRELCGQNDGQLWRDRMRDIIDAELLSPQRRASLARSFNSGYRSFSRTYQACTPNAQAAIGRFLVEGAGIADNLVRTFP